MEQKIVFVGEARICKQVAYVLDYQDYELTEKITDLSKYQDYEVYVCKFRRKGKIKTKNKNLKIYYLEDICKRIDAEYAASQQPVKQITASATEDKATTMVEDVPDAMDNITTTDVVTIENDTVIVNNVPETSQIEAKPVNKEPFLKKTWRRLTHPIQTFKKGCLRLKWWFEKVFYNTKNAIRRCIWKLKKCFKESIKKIKKLFTFRSKKIIDKVPIKYLKHMKASELFIRVLFSKPKNIICRHLETDVTIFSDGSVNGCCSALVPFGNTRQGSLDQVYNSIYARIVKLSSLNRSYCLCDLAHCNISKCFIKDVNNTLPEMKTTKLPEHLELQIDQTCNLSCPMCRKCHFIPNKYEEKQLQDITQKILDSHWLDEVNSLCFAGMGEVFYSPSYRNLIIPKQKRKSIMIISNGILFNQQNWDLIKDYYETFVVCISIDAATPETYQKIRGGNWNVLMKNLMFIGNLRKQNKIIAYTLNFVVQRDNYLEMGEFVKLCKEVGADHVYFTHLNFSDHHFYSYSEYLERCLIVDNLYLDYDLYKLLQDPIFKEPEVNLSGLEFFYNNSKSKYKH